MRKILLATTVIVAGFTLSSAIAKRPSDSGAPGTPGYTGPGTSGNTGPGTPGYTGPGTPAYQHKEAVKKKREAEKSHDNKALDHHK